jgi:hypothetical protein
MNLNAAPPVPRRRRHSAEFKGQVIQACQQPGVSIAATALHYGLNANLLRSWLKAAERRGSKSSELISARPAEFIPIQLPGPTAAPASYDIVIEVKRGASTVTVRWPGAAAADCATWLQHWLR